MGLNSSKLVAIVSSQASTTTTTVKIAKMTMPGGQEMKAADNRQQQQMVLTAAPKPGTNTENKNATTIKVPSKPAQPPQQEQKPENKNGRDSELAKRRASTTAVPAEAAKKSTDSTKNKPNTRELAQAKRRASERASYPLADALSPKERQKLLSNDAILPLGGSKFTSTMLKLHNSYRADHGVNSLKSSSELNKIAQSRAEALVRGNPQELPHTMGESIFMTTSDGKMVPSAAMACNDWYEPSQKYDYNCPRRYSRKGVYFMHMVWSTTKEMGSGRAVSGNGKMAVIALYRPRPNLYEARENMRPSIISDQESKKSEEVKL